MLHAVDRDVDRALRQAVDRGVARAARRVDAGEIDDEVERAAAGERQAGICFDVSVVETVDDCVLTTSEPAVTTTCSSMPPTSILTATPAGTPALSSTSLTVAVLKPARLTTTEYLPGFNCGMVNCPSALVTASDVTAGVGALDDDAGAGNDRARRIRHGAGQRRRGAALGEGRGCPEGQRPRRRGRQ